MFEIDKERFGVFLQEIRKDKGYTQKELAARVFVSDKAVSKWERGISLPDTALLIPLAEVLDVTVTELLKGQRLERSAQMNIDEVEELVTNTLEVSAEERKRKGEIKKKWAIRYYFCTALAVVETLLLAAVDSTLVTNYNLLMGVGMAIIFGAWFCLKIGDTLPSYYDENKISSYSDGVFRMNLGGVGIRFNNNNWPHIVKIGRVWMLTTSVILPLLYYIGYLLLPESGIPFLSFLVLPVILGFFIPMMIAAKKYE